MENENSISSSKVHQIPRQAFRFDVKFKDFRPHNLKEDQMKLNKFIVTKRYILFIQIKV